MIRRRDDIARAIAGKRANNKQSSFPQLMAGL
jgi:hypothetical protein